MDEKLSLIKDILIQNDRVTFTQLDSIYKSSIDIRNKLRYILIALLAIVVLFAYGLFIR
jgi:hypothetical protein